MPENPKEKKPIPQGKHEGTYTMSLLNKYGMEYKIIVHVKLEGKSEVIIKDKNGRDVASKTVTYIGEMQQFIHEKTTVWMGSTM